MEKRNSPVRLFYLPFFTLLFYLSVSCGAPQIIKVTKTRDKIPPANQMRGTTVILQNIAPAESPAGSDIKLAEFAIATNQLDIFWSGIQINQIGSAGDDDIVAIKIFLDDGNDVFEADKDIPIGTGQFKDKTANIALPQHALGGSVQLCYIVATTAQTALEGLSINIAIQEEKSFNTTDILGVSVPTGLPFTAGPTIIAKAEKPAAASSTALPGPVTPETAPPPVDEKDPIRAFLKDQERAKTIRMQENEFIAQSHYETALKLFRQFNYNEALDYLQRALQLNPYHKEAEKLRNEIQRILGSRSEEIKIVKTFIEDQLAIKIQETEIEVRNHFLKGEGFFAERNYKDAIAEFEKVVEKVKWIPYETPLREYQAKAEERLKSSLELRASQEEDIARQQRAAAARLAEEEEQRRRKEFAEKVRMLFHEAILSYERKQYDQTELLAKKILAIVPYFRAAEELRKEAIRARHYKVSADYSARRAEQLKNIADDQAEAVITYGDAEMVRYDPEIWEIASHRKQAGIVESTTIEDPDIVEIQRKLKTIKHNFILDGNVNLYEITDYLQQQYKIPIQYDPQVRNDGTPDEKKVLTLTGLPLEAGLRNLLELYNLTFMLKSKSLWIVKTTTPTEELEWRAYNVDDLVRQIPEFIGPTLEFEQSAGAGGWTMPQIETVGSKPPTTEELIDLIKKNTAKNQKGQSTWEGDTAVPGVSITKMGETNRLMIVHSKSAQEEVLEFLKTLRYFRSGMVAVETIFLATTNDFIESVGVELRDLTPAAASNIPEASLPAGLPPAPFGAGVFQVGRPPARDIRFRTAYSFRNQSGITEFPVGGRLNARGGLGLQWTILDRPQINVLLQMIEKTGKGQVLDAPKITALNGQRVNVSYIKQRYYIKDLEVLGGMQGYDPTMGTFVTGIVLDVKPVMSYDRKFITIHAFPSLVQLQQLRNVDMRPTLPPAFLLPGFGDTFIQLPWLSLQRCRTSAVVPDKGALLLGGMKRIQDRTMTASTPVFEKIPILGALFRRKMKTDEKEQLIMLIKAEIIELAEIEKELE
jgi:Flp pilus assembly secretin CpaC